MDAFIAQADVRELIALTSSSNYAAGNSYVTKSVAGAAGNSKGNQRLGIPSMALADGPADVRISFEGKYPKTGEDREQTLTAFPSCAFLAQTWDMCCWKLVRPTVGSCSSMTSSCCSPPA